MIRERTEDAGQAVVARALSWIGTPYRHQASRKGVGCDCLGLVRGVWRELYGAEPEAVEPYSQDWAEATGEERLLDAARRHFRRSDGAAPLPGQLLIFRWRPHLPAKHAGIAVDAGHFVHAYQGHAVTVSPLIAQWRRRIAGMFDFPALAAGPRG